MDRINDLSFLSVFVMGFVIALLYFYFGIYTDDTINTQLAEINKEITDLDHIITTKNKEIALEDEFRLALEQSKQRYGVISTYFPEDQTFTSLSGKIGQELEKWLVKEIQREPNQAGLTTSGFYQVLPIKYSLEGSYGRIMAFLYTLANHENIIFPYDVTIIGLPGSDLLRIETELRGYKFVSPEPQKNQGEGEPTT